MGEIGPIIADVGPWGAFIGLLLAITLGGLRGWFVTRATHERELEQAVARGDDWKDTATKWETVATGLTAQNGNLITSNKISDHFYTTYLEPRIPSDDTFPTRGVPNVPET